MRPRCFNHGIRARGRFAGLMVFVLSWGIPIAGFGEATEVLGGPEADYIVRPPLADDTSGVMRWVWVQERMQVARRDAAVRVPVFFAAGECKDPHELVLVRWPSRQPVAVQVDDVRHGADGGVARLHLWFKTDVTAGETQRWALIRSERREQVEAAAIAAKVSDGELEVEAAGTKAVFYLDLARRGPLASLQLENGPALKFADGAGAACSWRNSTGADDSVKPGDGGSLAWGSGPVFAKVVARSAGKSTASEVEQVFRIFSDGTMNIIQSIRPRGNPERMTVKTQEFLSGRLTDSGALSVQSQSAGIVESLAEVHRGYQVDGLCAAGRSAGWLVVPGSLGGTAGRVKLESFRNFVLHAPATMTSGEGDARPHTVRGFWAEVTLYPAKREGDELARAVLLAASQPLVAAVDLPGLGVGAAVQRIEDNVREMKPTGWVNESVVRMLNGRIPPFPKRKWEAESSPAYWEAAAQRAKAKVTGQTDRRLAEDEKGRAAGPLDPYHITYGATGMGYWLMNDDLPGPLTASLRAELEAVRRQLTRTDEQGWPYLDVFARTQNMQMGPAFLALADRGADPALHRFYRDQLAAPQIAAVMLRGLRPYEGRPQNAPLPSDELYQGVVDFFLRATEFALNESLSFHPVAFGRHLDAIDVNADLYHPAHAKASELNDGFAHANFFRMQSHLHRWLNWGPAPFMALLQQPVEDGQVPGSTEVWYYADALAGHWKNWPDQSWLFLAAKLPAKAAAYAPSSRPEPVKEVRVSREGNGNHLAWAKIAPAVAYRVYRLRPGRPPVWLNSPYISGATANPERTEWHDEEGNSSDRYRIHAIDAAGRESGW